MKFPGKIMIILTVTKNQGFTLSLENTILEGPAFLGLTSSLSNIGFLNSNLSVVLFSK